MEAYWAVVLVVALGYGVANHSMLVIAAMFNTSRPPGARMVGQGYFGFPSSRSFCHKSRFKETKQMVFVAEFFPNK